jgi:hypothetical protein
MIVNPPPPGDCQAELRRLLVTETFRHSDGLHKLLEYLGAKALNGGAAELKEYTIGIEAFDKSADYDPQLDPAVRVLASKLRRKLEDYYLKEGAGNPLRVELPKGHYALKFSARPEDAAPHKAVLASQVRRWRWISAVLGTSVVILALVVIESRSVSQGQPAIQGAWTPELHAMWKPYLESSRPVLLALGTPLFTKFSGAFFRSPSINNWEEAQKSDQLPLLQKSLGSSYALPWYSFTGVGEATGAFLLSRLLHTRKPNLVLKRSNALSWDDIQYHNVIFVGSPKFNSHLKDFPSKRDFVIEGGVIKNLRPRSGEQEEYRDVWKTKVDLVEDYALIVQSPGLHDRGNIMVLASSSTEGTWAAVEYVTEAAHARDMVSRLRQSSGDLPQSYQIVVKARFKEQVPIEISYVTHREDAR